MSLAQRLGLTGPSRTPKRFQPFQQQAGYEALVRYAPLWDDINTARASSAETMRQRIAQARSAGAIASNSATLAAKALAEGPNANAPAIQSVIGMLGQRAADAPIVANQQVEQATAQHLKELGEVHSKRASLAGQIGAFTAGRYDDLVGADRKLRHDANQAKAKLKQDLLTSGVTPSGKVRPGGPKDPKATQLPKTPSTIAKVPSNYPGSEAEWNRHSRGFRADWLKQHGAARPGGKDSFGNTPKDRRGAQDSFDRAVRMARTTGGDDWQKVADFLVFKNVNPVMAVAAAQQVVLGHVGPKTVKRLRQRGVHGGYKRHVKPGQEPVPPSVVNTVTGIIG